MYYIFNVVVLHYLDSWQCNTLAGKLYYIFNVDVIHKLDCPGVYYISGSQKGEEKMKNEISVWKRLVFITLTVALAFVVSYALFTGGAIG